MRGIDHRAWLGGRGWRPSLWHTRNAAFDCWAQPFRHVFRALEEAISFVKCARRARRRAIAQETTRCRVLGWLLWASAAFVPIHLWLKLARTPMLGQWWPRRRRGRRGRGRGRRRRWLHRPLRGMIHPQARFQEGGSGSSCCPISPRDESYHA